MSANKTIGVIAPINWNNPVNLPDGMNYVQFLEKISLYNSDLILFILNFESIEDNGNIQFYDLKKGTIGATNIESFSLIHFLDFESSINLKDTLKQKWSRITTQLSQFETKNILTINSVKAIKYCFEKKYLLDLKCKNIPIINTDTIESSTHFEEIRKRYLNGRFIIKPINGESGSYIFDLNKLSKQNYDLISKQSDILLIQPFQDEIRNGEFSMLFFQEEFCHAVVKTPANIGRLFPPKFIIRSYNPSNEEIEFGKLIYSYFPVKLDIFRVDFIKVINGIRLMEVESVDPFHYVIIDLKEYAEKLGAFYRMIIN